jgi:hypothetical protein
VCVVETALELVQSVSCEEPDLQLCDICPPHGSSNQRPAQFDNDRLFIAYFPNFSGGYHVISISTGKC